MTKEKTAAAEAVKVKEKPAEFFKELAKVVIVAMLIAVFFRTLFYDPYNIPSESMLPTLMTGDYIFVSKMAYGYSKHSTPYFSLDLFDGRILEGEVRRGDVVVFKLPRDNQTDYIKRVMGLPGDRMQMRGGVLYINGDEVKKERIEDFVFEESANMNCLRYPNYRHPQAEGPAQCRYPQYLETLPNGLSYNVLDLEPFGLSDNTPVYTVPGGHYFAMGDNRDNSADSRKPTSRGVGFIPAENLVGRAVIIFYSSNGNAKIWQVWKWFGAARGDRFLTGLQAE
ncbi:MAG: signal peptidase I [Proteobacteria bacterium]|nr:signal peptidase I [Pseudomonadota bacterium]